MTSLVVDRPSLDRTEAFPLPAAEWGLPTGTGQSVSRRSEDSMVVTFTDGRFIISGGQLAARLMLENYLLLRVDPATSSMPPLLRQVSSTKQPTPAQRTVAQDAIAEIRALSGLKNEEIAPLAGVSRRSIQAWVAGEQISARKEQRLRALCDAVRALATSNPEMTRRRLFDHTAGNVRAYDLMVEGRFGEAVDLVMGRRATVLMPAAPQAHDLASQLDHHEGQVELPPGRLDRRFSGRLRR